MLIEGRNLKNVEFTPIHGYRVQKRVVSPEEAKLTSSKDLCYYDLGDGWFVVVRYPSKLVAKPGEPRGLHIYFKRGDDGSMTPEDRNCSINPIKERHRDRDWMTRPMPQNVVLYDQVHA